jgi:hypothetical protein
MLIVSTSYYCKDKNRLAVVSNYNVKQLFVLGDGTMNFNEKPDDIICDLLRGKRHKQGKAC